MQYRIVTALAVLLALSGCRNETTSPNEDRSLTPSQASTRPIEGWFHVLWVDLHLGPVRRRCGTSWLTNGGMVQSSIWSRVWPPASAGHTD